MIRVAEHVERTDTGRHRRGNEDSYVARAPLFAVADGMGGAQAGEVGIDEGHREGSWVRETGKRHSSARRPA